MNVELINVNKYYGDYHASRNVSITIPGGQMVALLGPSGSGKTTILRMIAGLEHPDSGDILIDGVRVNDVEPAKRGIGFLFQSYALFRYMTVFDNIAFPLTIEKWKKKDIKERVEELLELIGLGGLGSRYPNELSGGQRQRVAFARALAANPKVLLLDEPFAAIDAKVKQELRAWLKETIQKIGITTIFVTHDQEEAVEISDQIIVTNQGTVEQMGNPMKIYQRPKTPFVAQFVGKSTRIEGYDQFKGFRLIDGAKEAVVRPEFVKLHKRGTLRQFMGVAEKGIIEQVLFQGNRLEVIVNVNGHSLKANHEIDGDIFEEGETVEVLIYRLYVFDDTKAYVLENSGMNTKQAFYI